MSYIAAQRFWNLMGRPAEHNSKDTAKRWSLIMGDCQGEAELDDETFLEFLRWAVKSNPMSAEYLQLSRDPAVVLQRNLPTLLRYFKAFQARLVAKADREAQLKPKSGKEKHVLHTEPKFKQKEV